MMCLATLDIEDGIELISDCLKTVCPTHATLQWLTHGQQLDATKHNIASPQEEAERAQHH
jgi:hypothetical protein